MDSLLTRIDARGRAAQLKTLLPGPDLGGTGPVEAVRAILDQVRVHGDAALRELTSRFDHVDLDELRVPQAEIEASLAAVSPELRTALETARDNIDAYHRTQLHPDGRYADRGLTVRELRRPVGRAGLYVPGGRAPLASTVLMTAVPARVAGVAELAMVTPPGPDGSVHPAVLAAAAVAGVDEVYRVGGAQAVAALAYGTESIPAVDVIVGPGNVYVATAERLVAQQGAVGVPSAFTGPSEVAVVADGSVDPQWAAIDLVLQAEHGPDGLSYLITWSEEVADAVAAAVDRITAASPRRAEITSTLDKGGWAVLVDGPDEAVAAANVVAAEHLELQVADPEAMVAGIHQAGAVFTGPWAPASVGDYVAGPNHVLPTARSARFGSALRVDDFCKHIHVIDLDRDALERLAPHVEALAEVEGLVAHADSVRIRVGRG
ncbi:MAG TPA: histidinol dehydrogenase [Acidimicrobiales bacterium]|nr:histidinol dehydrogenase [Acidimicrobiales bacterium]